MPIGLLSRGINSRLFHYTQYTAGFTENLFRSLADPNTTFLTTNTTDHHDITEIFLKVVLNTKTLNPFLAKLYILCMIASVIRITEIQFT